MLSSLALRTLRTAAPVIARAPVTQAVTARYATRFMSSAKPFAVDAPDGDHDFQDVVRSPTEMLVYKGLERPTSPRGCLSTLSYKFRSYLVL